MGRSVLFIAINLFDKQIHKVVFPRKIDVMNGYISFNLQI
jgi:hypothetical protein